MTAIENKISNPWSRIKDLLIYALGQARTIKKPFPGIMHLLIFWGVLIQVIGTAIKIMQMGLFVPFTWPLFSEKVYFAYELIMDLAGVAILLGVVMALIRRWIIKPSYLVNSWDDYYALILLALIPLVGFITEGLRIFLWKPDWAAWAPIGNWASGIFHMDSPLRFPGISSAFDPFPASCRSRFTVDSQHPLYKNAASGIHPDPDLS